MCVQLCVYIPAPIWNLSNALFTTHRLQQGARMYTNNNINTNSAMSYSVIKMYKNKTYLHQIIDLLQSVIHNLCDCKASSLQ